MSASPSGKPHARCRWGWLFGLVAAAGLAAGQPLPRPTITPIQPPEKQFFSKSIDFHGIPIKAHEVVSNDALYAAYDRLNLILGHLPMATSNLVAAGVELHIIGRDQVTTDLPEWRHDKGKPLPEYNGLTRDQRTRGMGGLLVSCGEENLLRLEKDKYRGRDICIHEFAHAIRNFGLPPKLTARFDQQYRRSLSRALWKGAYSATNPDEFFAELSMWYFGTHGDLHMTGDKPADGPDGLKQYDPEAFALFDDFYQGRLQADRPTLHLNPAKSGPKLNPRMYGIFLEEINHGVDGGLYAELIRNRGFEDSRPPEGYSLRDGAWRNPGGFDSGFARYGYSTNGLPFWSLVQEGLARGAIQLETTGGITQSSAYCLRLDIEAVDGGRIGVANAGFFGIGITAGESYALSLYARGKHFEGPLSVRLEDASGAACSEAAPVKNIGTGWKQFKATLKATRTESKARLVITAEAPGKVWLDFVSLMPVNTWKHRPNGLRADLARMIADLKPGFVRFPGGCVVEGGSIETAYSWKLTVGPVEQRSERWGPWNYRETHGLGLFEYLQFIEDLGAEPLWVGFAGQTCIFRERQLVPMTGMDWVRDNFLDLLDYANGPAASKWGALRAEAGHPAPFGLKLVEIGNENQGPEYGERYRFIHHALKAKHPDLTCLADLSWTSRESLGNAQYDIEDRHHYSSPRWFMSRFNEYDARDRRLPPLYLGEVAVTSDDGGPLRGNLRAALAEGVFLLGCERNADAVRMVSYAPLLAHVDGRTELTGAPPPWHAMIYFDGTRAFGTVSYYLWKLFAENRPDHTVQTEFRSLFDAPPAIAGGIGVGTWNTSAEFKDVRVEKDGAVLYTNDLSAPHTGWTRDGGRWSVKDGAYRQSDETVGLSGFGDSTWTDYTLTLKARKLSGAEGFLILFGRKPKEKFWWNIGGWGNREHAIEFNQTEVGPHVPGSVELNRWYDIRIELRGRRIRCFLDGQLIHDVTASEPQRFFASAGPDAATGDIILKVINASTDGLTANIDLEGAPRIASPAQCTVLTADEWTDNNSLDHPRAVAPAVTSVTVPATLFIHAFPPQSLTVLRFKTQP